MRIKDFGADSESYGLDVIIGWLESLIEAEAEDCETSKSPHRKARLDRAYDGLEALQQVSEWTPLLTKHYTQNNAAKAGKPK